jgi:type II secretory pathway component PulF
VKGQAKKRDDKLRAEKAKVRLSQDLVLRFYRELSTMLGAGVPLAQTLDSLAEFAEDPRMHEVLADVSHMISSGRTLSKALSFYPQVFSTVGVSMVRLGESTGRMVDSLNRLSVWMQRDQDVKKKVQAALIYPAFSLGLTILMTLGLFVFVIPDFLDMLVDMGAHIPPPTRFLLFVTNFMTSPVGWAVFGLSLAFLYYSVKGIMGSPQGKVMAFTLIYDIPVLGPTLLSAALARYAAAAETMFACGVDIFTATQLCALASGSPVMLNDVKSLRQSLQEGESMSSHMQRRPNIYPGCFGQFVSAGEEAARMEPMFRNIREFYDQEVSHRLKTLTTMIEPIMMTLIAFIVGFIVVSLLLPLHNFISHLG